MRSNYVATLQFIGVIASMTESTKFLLKYHSRENKFLRWPF